MSEDEKREGAVPSAVGCGFLSLKELDAAVAGRLDSERREQFDRHVGRGCADCVMLAADLATFRRVLAGGVSEAERAEADRQAEKLRSLLRAEVRRREPASS